MTTDSGQQFATECSGELSPAARAALADLRQAHAYACRLGRDRWAFAVELEHLVARAQRSATCDFLRSVVTYSTPLRLPSPAIPLGVMNRDRI